MTRRAAALAGAWYPGDPARCREAILAKAAGTTPERGPWHALVGPHAGWTWSGEPAARTYRWLAEAQDEPPELVVIFGSHRGPRGPNTVFRGEAWETPCGDLRTARELADRLAGLPGIGDEPIHPLRPDNGVELHLPFVAHFFGQDGAAAEILVIGVAAAPVAMDLGRTVGELVAESGRRAVFVGSTDLTHYGPDYGFTPAGSGPRAVEWVRTVNDRRFLDAVLAGDSRAALDDALAHHSACCPGAVAATLEATKACFGAIHPRLVSHLLSADIRPAPSFVGYAGLVL